MLNELAIAVGVKGGNAAYILLEDEKNVSPPSICYIQWLNMSIWKEKPEEGDEVFNEWFEAKMKELFEIIKSKESREFVVR